MKYHLVNINLNAKALWPCAYDEVIETIYWGLTELGHEVTSGINFIELNKVNILFGHRLLTIDQLKNTPNNTIIYNLEQMGGLSINEIRDVDRYAAENFQIWDYSIFHKDFWESLNPKHPPKIVQIGYAPILTRIPKVEYNIDVLIYGATTNDRLRLYHLLSCAGIRSVYLCGIYGALRDNLISQSKIILNINKYDKVKTFEIVRASYLFANKKAFITDKSTVNTIENDIKDVIYLFDKDSVVEDCERILASDLERTLLENNGFEAIVKRDIRKILSAAI